MASVEIGSVVARGRRFLDRARGGRVVLGCCLVFAWQGLILAVPSDQVFRDPDFEVVIFDQDALSLQGDDRVMVVEALAALASNFPNNGLVDMNLREKALAIALRLDALNVSARASREALLNGQASPKTKLFSELSSISKVLSQRALTMKEEGEPEDAILVPLLMELAWVIYPSVGDGKAAMYAAAMDAAGDRLPAWGKLVHLEKSPSKSSLRAAKLLSRGRVYNKKIQLVAAEAKRRQQQLLVEQKQATKQKQVMVAVAKEQRKKKLEEAGRVLLPNTEMNVVAWTASRVAGLQYHVAKMKLDIRGATEADAPFFENGKGKSKSPEVMGMRFKYMPAPRSAPTWMSLLFKVMKSRVGDDWPRGKLGEVDFVLMGNQVPLEPNQRLVGGMGAGTALALNSALQGHPLDPLTIIHFRMASDQSVIDPPNGDLSEVIKIGKTGGFRLMVVASGAENKMRDWLALGELDRFIHPQIVAVDRFDELVQFTRADREPRIEEAIQLFSEIEDLTEKMTLTEAAKNEVVQQRLQAIVEQFPQHLSARMLLAYGKGTGELKVSLHGSLKVIKEVLQPMRQRYDSALDIDALETEVLEKLQDQVDARLRDLRNQLDGEVKELMNMSEDVADSMLVFLRLKNRTTSTGLQKREAVEETLDYFNEEFRRLQNKVANQKRETLLR